MVDIQTIPIIPAIPDIPYVIPGMGVNSDYSVL
jgi:hypothetical protein